MHQPVRPFRSRDWFADPRRSDMVVFHLVDADEIALRRQHAPAPVLRSHTVWHELYREKTGQLAEGGVLKFAVTYRGVAAETPRHNH